MPDKNQDPFTCEGDYCGIISKFQNNQTAIPEHIFQIVTQLASHHIPFQVSKQTVALERDNIRDNYRKIGMDEKKLQGVIAQEVLLR